MQGYTSTGWRKEESGCLDRYRSVVAKRIVHAAISIEAENRQPKISGSRRENFPISLNGHSKRRSGVRGTNQYFSTGAKTGIQSTIGVVAQQARLLAVLHRCDRSGYYDLPITLEGCSIGACVSRSDDAVDTESRVQGPGLGH